MTTSNHPRARMLTLLGLFTLLGCSGADPTAASTSTAAPSAARPAAAPLLTTADVDPSALADGITPLRRRFRDCYRRGLAIDPAMSGRTVIHVEVDAHGDVVATEVGANDGLSSEVAGCLAAVAGTAHFDVAGPARFAVPITFVSSAGRPR